MNQPNLTTRTTNSLSSFNLSPAVPIATSENLGILRSCSQAVTREQCRALLACTALEGAMVLASIQTQCYRIAPWGEESYQQICSAYAASASGAILRW
jgi:hypothetical protein